MSVKRYGFGGKHDSTPTCDCEPWNELEDGPWVSHSDHLALEAKLKAWKTLCNLFDDYCNCDGMPDWVVEKFQEADAELEKLGEKP